MLVKLKPGTLRALVIISLISFDMYKRIQADRVWLCTAEESSECGR